MSENERERKKYRFEEMYIVLHVRIEVMITKVLDLFNKMPFDFLPPDVKHIAVVVVVFFCVKKG